MLKIHLIGDRTRDLPVCSISAIKAEFPYCVSEVMRQADGRARQMIPDQISPGSFPVPLLFVTTHASLQDHDSA
jgi:hypothetical protein